MTLPDITIFRGDDWSTTITRKAAGTAIDITGYVYWLTVKATDTDSDAAAVLQKSFASHLDAVNGVTVLSATNVETNIIPGKYYYDIQEVTDADVVTTFGRGKFIVLRDISVTTE